MASHFHLLTPVPGVATAIKASAVFDLPANALSHCFAAQPPVPLFANSFAARLAIHHAALDGGYGGGQLLPAIATADDEAPLGAYLRARLELLISALDLHEPAGDGRVGLRAFVRALDKTEKTDLGYLLGAVLARVAAGRWLQQVDTFWHADVVTRAAVVLGGVARATVEEPDFIIRRGNDWFTLESKGSVQTLTEAGRWSKLKEGLMQAAKWSSLRVLDHTLVGPPQVRPVSAFACSLTDFDAADELQLRLVDPAPTQGAPALVVEPFARLMHFQQAMRQWRRLGWPLEVGAPRRGIPQTEFFSWKLLQRASTDEASLYLGMPWPWHELEQALDLAVAGVEHVVSGLRRQLRGPDLMVTAQAPVAAAPLLRRLRAWAKQIPAAGPWVAQLGNLLRAGNADEVAAAPTLAAVIDGLLQAEGLPGGHSIAGLLRSQQTGIQAAQLAVVTAELQAPGQALATSHGLLVVGAAWRRQDGMRGERRLKL